MIQSRVDIDGVPGGLRCSATRKYYVPKPDDVPEPLRGLSKEALQALSPLEVLGRGYSMTRTTDGTVVRTADDLQAGDQIVTTLARGHVTSRVESTRPPTPGQEQKADTETGTR